MMMETCHAHTKVLMKAGLQGMDVKTTWKGLRQTSDAWQRLGPSRASQARAHVRYRRRETRRRQRIANRANELPPLERPPSTAAANTRCRGRGRGGRGWPRGAQPPRWGIRPGGSANANASARSAPSESAGPPNLARDAQPPPAPLHGARREHESRLALDGAAATGGPRGARPARQC